MSIRFRYEYVKGAFGQALLDKYRPVARAATLTMRETSETVKREGRGDIAAAGMSSKWQNALRVQVFPKAAESADAAVYVKHNISYAGIFEEGGHIRGTPFLWLPLSSTPKMLGRQRMTPELYERSIGDLFFIRRPSGNPLLAARVRSASSSRLASKVTMASLRRGTSGKGTLRTIPLFVGVKSVDIGKKFHIRQICERARARLADLYFKHFEDN